MAVIGRLPQVTLQFERCSMPCNRALSSPFKHRRLVALPSASAARLTPSCRIGVTDAVGLQHDVRTHIFQFYTGSRRSGYSHRGRTGHYNWLIWSLARLMTVTCASLLHAYPIAYWAIACTLFNVGYARTRVGVPLESAVSALDAQRGSDASIPRREPAPGSKESTRQQGNAQS
jgi:hypothetical protein